MLYKNKKIDFYAIRVSASLFYSYSCFLFDVLGFQPPWDKIMIHTLHCCLLVVRTTRLRLMIILSSKDFDTQTFFLKNFLVYLGATQNICPSKYLYFACAEGQQESYHLFWLCIFFYPHNLDSCFPYAENNSCHRKMGDLLDMNL